MYRIISTRFFDFYYYQKFFVDFYSTQVDEIHIWVEEENLQKVKTYLSDIRNLKFFVYPQKYLIEYHRETEILNFIYQKELRYIENLINQGVKMPFLMVFADEDEFFELKKVKTLHKINYSVFLEFYLPPKAEHSAESFWHLAKNNKLKGKITEAWKDPFYKNNILVIDYSSINYLKKCWFTSGFHRIICNNKIAPKINYIIGYHLKGAPLVFYKEKILKAFSKQSTKNDWLYIHYVNELEKIQNYPEFYSRLKTSYELRQELSVLLANRQESYFDNEIIKENIKNPLGHKPLKTVKDESVSNLRH